MIWKKIHKINGNIQPFPRGKALVKGSVVPGNHTHVPWSAHLLNAGPAKICRCQNASSAHKMMEMETNYLFQNFVNSACMKISVAPLPFYHGIYGDLEKYKNEQWKLLSLWSTEQPDDQAVISSVWLVNASIAPPLSSFLFKSRLGRWALIIYRELLRAVSMKYAEDLQILRITGYMFVDCEANEL